MKFGSVMVLFTLLCAVVGTPAARAQEVPGCGNIKNAFGPFDYRDPVDRDQHLPIVEINHFNADVESLRRGVSDANIIGDIDYTLRAFPNHHRALNTVARYALQRGRFLPGRIPSADCYFKRALAFRPDDEIVHMLYGNYLKKTGSLEYAQTHYEEALRLAPESVEASYNAGLFFAEKGDLVRAKQLAKIAYDGGYPLPGLKKKIAAAESKGAR